MVSASARVEVCASLRPLSTWLCCEAPSRWRRVDDVAEPLDLRHQPLDALVEGLAAQGEQVGAAHHRVAELLAGQLGGHVGGRAHGVLALHAEAGLELDGLLLERGDDPLVGGAARWYGRRGCR